MVFFCFFTSTPYAEEQTGSSAPHFLRRGCLNDARLRDDDLGLGGARRRAERLDLLDKVQALGDLTCGVVSINPAMLPIDDVPNTTWAPSSHEVTTVVMKNWEPLVFLPALAMERVPGFVCFNWKFSSVPQIR